VLTAFNFISRELAMLVMAGLLGAAPVMSLRRHASWPIRVALMPVVGFCLGTSVTTTLLWFFPAASTFWILPMLVVASCALTWRLARTHEQPEGEEPEREEEEADTGSRRRLVVGLLQCLLVLAVVSGPLALTLVENHSDGPVAFQVYDAAAYVGIQDAMQHQSIHEAEVTTTPNKDLVQNEYAALMRSAQETELSPMAANMNELLGLSATETQSPFLLAVVAIGGLGLLGALGLALGSLSWWSVFGACLFGGGFLMQLFLDGSEGAICGLAVLVPFGVTSVVAAKDRRWWSLVVPTVLLSGLYALYPVFVGLIALTVAFGLCAAALTSGALRRRDWRALLMGVVKTVLVAGVAIVLDIEGFSRAWTIWMHVIRGGFGAVGLPYYRLPVQVFPGWLMQMVDFYSFATPAPLHVSLVEAIIVPVIVLVALLPALRRNAFAWLTIPGIIFALGGAAQQVRGDSCTYCEDRNLLPMSVILMFIIGLGVVVLARKRPLITGAIVCVAATFIAYSAYNEEVGYSAGTYFLPTSVRTVADHLPTNPGYVDIEAFDTGPRAPGEFPLIYYMVYEITHDHVSAPADVPSDPGLAYVFSHPLDGSVGEIFNPNYRYVLTRIPGVKTDRKTISSAPGVALERRTSVLDVTVDGGLATALEPEGNPTGVAEVNGPVRFLVAGKSAALPSVRFTFTVPASVDSIDQSTLAKVGKVRGTILSGCIESTTVPGAPLIHSASVTVPPNVGILLTSMRTSTRSCG
jgi:hypothetical protein